MQLFLVGGVETKMALWQPIGQIKRKWIAISSFKYQILVAAIVKEYVFLIDNGMKFADGFYASSLKLIWGMKDDLFIALES